MVKRDNFEESFSSDFEENDSVVTVSSPATEVFETKVADAGMRLDLFLAMHLGITRSFSRKLIENAYVTISPGKKAKPGLKLTSGLVVAATLPPPEAMDLEPENIPFGVIYEDPWLVVVNKPAGLVVHPAPGNWRGTLVHGLLYRFQHWGVFNNIHRPGIVHRLDSPTSGLLVVAREQRILDALQRQFRMREVKKHYLALVEGIVRHPKGRIELPIGRSSANRLRMAVDPNGKNAVTEFRLLWSRQGYSLVECRILTGRTHQIRLHMSHIGLPLVGDSLYGASKKFAARLGRVFLHSWKLCFQHPETEERVSFRCFLPDELTALLREILSRDRG